MKIRKAPGYQPTRRTLSIACVTALVVTFTAALPRTARADRLAPPAVPEKLRVPDGHEVFGLGHAFGTQNYICLPQGEGFVFKLFTPQANLFNGADRQVMTHFFSPNPDEFGAVRPTWQHSRDTSAVWARGSESSTDAAFVAPGAVAWLLLEVVGREDGPTGGRELTETTHIHRVNTAGGLAPATGCAVAGDVGNTAFVPYKADYFFYRKSPPARD